MSAYHNPDWAECYDLWVRSIFGDGPVEDMAVFESLLEDQLTKSNQKTSFSIVDLGTGSGRVLIGLQDVMRKHEETRFEVWGLEPSSAMLERAKRFWAEGVTKYKRKGLWEKVVIEDHWVQCGATDFADHIVPRDRKLDLIIFAAGGLGHITSDAEILQFLINIKQTLHPGGKAVISVLSDFFLDGHSRSNTSEHAIKQLSESNAPLSVTEMGQKPVRIPSVDRPGLVYVKHPTVERMSGRIKTETFKLDIEDNGRNVLRSHELSWDERMFDPKNWESAIAKSGLHITSLGKGQIQVWYFLEHRNQTTP